MNSGSRAGAGVIRLVIPVYGGLRSFGSYLPGLARELEVSGLPLELVVVDDGNGAPAAGEMARLTAALPPTLRPRFVSKPLNQGKGAAILDGWLGASADSWLAFVDADGSVPAVEVVRVLGLALADSSSPAAVVAVRTEGQRRVRRYVHRRLLGRLLGWLARGFLGISVADTQCGLKAVRADLLVPLLSRFSERRFGFDLELLCALAERGARVQPVAVDWAESGESSVVLWRDVPSLACGLFRVAWRRFRGRYRERGVGA